MLEFAKEDDGGEQHMHTTSIKGRRETPQFDGHERARPILRYIYDGMGAVDMHDERTAVGEGRQASFGIVWGTSACVLSRRGI